MTRPEVVQAIFKALSEMDPFALAPLTGRGVTDDEHQEAQRLFAASLMASSGFHDRQAEVWEVLLHRQWDSPPSWQQLFDDLEDGGREKLAALYDAMPAGARVEYDRRFGRPDLFGDGGPS
jgi:hypothetical protein